MHMPKRNLFAYLCATLLGVVFIILAARGRFEDTLANIILVIIGLMMIVSGIVNMIRHVREQKENNKK